MDIFKQVIYVHVFKIIVFILIGIACLFTFWFFIITDPKQSSLFGGLATGLFVAIIQLLLMWTEYSEMEKIKKLKIKKILAHRDDETLYKSVIQSAENKILVLGNTVSRFLQDFADEGRTDKRTLLDALDRKVNVKFLLPEPKWLNKQDDQDKAKMASRKIAELAKKYKGHFECRYYDHAPFHNLVMADNECLVGPIFPNKSSKDCPAIYTDVSSIFVRSYIDYFNYEWTNAKPCVTNG